MGKPKVVEQDKVIQIVVTQMLQETHVPVSDRDYKYHMEQIALIRLGNLLKSGTLTFHKYNTVKQQHLADIKDALRNNEIDSYDYPTDIFTRLDFHIGIKERPSGVDPMIIEGPEEDYGDMERKDRDKVRDQFAERQRKAKPDEKIIITPANVSLRGKAGESDAVFVDGPEEDLGDQERKDRAKVKDHFPEREKKAKEEEKIVITPAVLTEQEPEEEEDEETRKARDKVRDEFAERRSIKPAEPEKIIIKPAVLKEKQPEEPEDVTDSPAARDKVRDEFAERQRKQKEEDKFKITPRAPPQRKGSREDHSMIKLGKMLGEHGGLTPDKYNQVKGTYRPRDGRLHSDERMSPGPRRKFSGDDRDIKVQQQVSVMIQKAQVRIDSKSFQHHSEHIIMIRLGRLHRIGSLTFDKYAEMKASHRIQLDEHVRYREIDTYDHSVDVFARLDEAITKHPIIIQLTMSGAKPKVVEQDKVIQIVVTQMLQETHVPVSDRDYKYHMEQIALIRLGNLLKSGTLTFHKYNTVKQQHLADIKDALRNNEIDSYDYPTDIFTRLDFHIGIKERPSGVDPMIIEGPEEDYGDMERKDRDKVRDQFAERQR